MDCGHSVAEVLTWANFFLRRSGSGTARLDAEVLLAHILGVERVWLYTHPEALLSDTDRRQYCRLVQARAGRTPLQYLTQRQEFMGLEFAVLPGVLIPRPETELLVEVLLERVKGRPAPALADIGTGSGAIAVSLAHYLPHSRILAVDISPAALAVARKNAARHGVSDRITFLSGDLLAPLADLDLAGGLDAIAANPPYIPSGDIAGLSPEVREHEPRLALDGGPDGLDNYRRLIPAAGALLRAGGWLAFEVGAGQAAAVADLMQAAGYRQVERHQDLAGWERVVGGQKAAG